ncbi:uncharacterized protein LOC125696254 [Lagopus muta]|uniref:uncharacterized protein LOC125696254 n=1 Tax=Lagopus muta TaxID=64668 RepID=UPI00209CA5A0|nr:uncharacterized protein LOC125696254 [Lagopus muta]
MGPSAAARPRPRTQPQPPPLGATDGAGPARGPHLPRAAPCVRRSPRSCGYCGRRWPHVTAQTGRRDDRASHGCPSSPPSSPCAGRPPNPALPRSFPDAVPIGTGRHGTDKHCCACHTALPSHSKSIGCSLAPEPNPCTSCSLQAPQLLLLCTGCSLLNTCWAAQSRAGLPGAPLWEHQREHHGNVHGRHHPHGHPLPPAPNQSHQFGSATAAVQGTRPPRVTPLETVTTPVPEWRLSHREHSGAEEEPLAPCQERNRVQAESGGFPEPPAQVRSAQGVRRPPVCRLSQALGAAQWALVCGTNPDKQGRSAIGR